MEETPCIGDDCNETTLNESRLCRDCDIERLKDQMRCSVCDRMRYAQDSPLFSDFAVWLWGKPCQCDPQPPSVREVHLRAKAEERGG